MCLTGIIFICATALHVNAWTFPNFTIRTIADEGEFPYLVGIHVWKYDRLAHICSGSIITARWILTAARCLSFNGKYVIQAGSNTIFNGGQWIPAMNLIKYPKYRGGNTHFDIGLIKLKEDLIFNDRVKAINLPEEDPEDGYVGEIVGWGSITTNRTDRTTNLQFAAVSTMPSQYCKRGFEFIQRPDLADKIGKSHICIMTVLVPCINAGSPCIGDFGGPLIIRNDIEPTKLFGVLSWTYHVKITHMFVVKVTPYIDFIMNTIRDSRMADQC